jgi:hypothetical protein
MKAIESSSVQLAAALLPMTASRMTVRMRLISAVGDELVI